MMIDAAVIAAILIGVDIAHRDVWPSLERALGIGPDTVRNLLIGAALILCIPFVAGIVRCARQLGQQMARPGRPAESLDLAAAPRRAMVVGLQLAILALFAVPLVALTLPMIPPMYTAPVLAVGFAAVAVAFWRSAENLQEHVSAVAGVIVEALAKQAIDSSPRDLDHVRKMLPGMGELTPFEIRPGSHAVGQTLAALNVRGLTGATVIAITRGTDEPVTIPSGKEVLREGDVLALTGSHDAVDAAVALLSTPPE
jgi:CPA2 family monovalent cation:H+ antiporter-2